MIAVVDHLTGHTSVDADILACDKARHVRAKIEHHIGDVARVPYSARGLLNGICIGEIVNISADESILNEDGKIDAKKLDPIIYDSVTHAYWNLGEKVGQAFSDGKKIK